MTATQSMPLATRRTAVAALALAALGTVAMAARPHSAPTAAPAEYAALTRTFVSSLGAAGGPRWRFRTPTAELFATDMDELLRQLGCAKGPRQEEVVIVNAVAGAGWELLSHSRTPTADPDIRDGTPTGATTTRTVDQWWFRRATPR